MSKSSPVKVRAKGEDVEVRAIAKLILVILLFVLASRIPGSIPGFSTNIFYDWDESDLKAD